MDESPAVGSRDEVPVVGNDVNKDWTHKDKDKDKD